MQLNVTNQTEEDLFSCHQRSVEAYRYFAVLWGCAVTITGTVGNLLTVLAFASDPRLRTRFNSLIANLAAADLLYCTVLQPISVDSYLHLRWRTGPLWCRIFGFLLFLSNSVSILTLCLLAVGRYLLVGRRATFDRVFSGRGLFFVLTSTWALGSASFGPLWSVFVFVPQVCTCSFDRIRGRPYTTILLFFYFFFGLGCVGVFYLLIYKRVRVASQALLRYRMSRRSSRRVRMTEDSSVDSAVTTSYRYEVSSNAQATPSNDTVTPGNPSEETKTTGSVENKAPDSSKATDAPSVPPAPATSAPSSSSSSSHPAASGEDREFKRVTRMCFTVFLCFVFCFVPFLLLNIADKNNRAPRVLHMFAANLTWLNSCINPVLYALMNRQFRQAYQALLHKAAAPLGCLARKS